MTLPSNPTKKPNPLAYSTSSLLGLVNPVSRATEATLYNELMAGVVGRNKKQAITWNQNNNSTKTGGDLLATTVNPSHAVIYSTMPIPTSQKRSVYVGPKLSIDSKAHQITNSQVLRKVTQNTDGNPLLVSH